MFGTKRVWSHIPKISLNLGLFKFAILFPIVLFGNKKKVFERH